MFSRALNVPPKALFTASNATSSGEFAGGARDPAIITDCSAPGLSIR